MFAPVESIIEAARKGEMFIMLDNEERENEGDIIIMADYVNDHAINFMITHGRGLVCIAISQEIADRFGLALQPKRNVDPLSTAFTVSVDAKVGITTGVSTEDRVKTIKILADPNGTQDDLRTPGHMFPIIANEGGVLYRQGHTEATVEIAKLAGLNHAGVMCEIIKNDGDMARRDEVMNFAKKYNILVSTVESLVNYVKANK